jgi:hypothetical protein
VKKMAKLVFVTKFNGVLDPKKVGKFKTITV